VRSINPLALVLLAGVLATALAAPFARAVPPPGGSASAIVAPSTSAAPAPADSAAPAGSSSAEPKPRALPSPIDATNTCASCHSTLTDPKLRAPSKEFASSTHRDERIGCVGCHHGDPRDPTVGAHAKSLGFTPHPSHSEVPAICGGCHNDAEFMRRINGRIPVGQAALFKLSLHGRLSASGDTQAPNCATCHGKHGTIAPSSPLSPVNRLNVAKLCSGCHADPKHMAKYELRTDQFEKWEKSVHGQAFLKGNPNAPTCTGCHGAHSAAPPDASSVAHACGRCHEEEMGFFEQSPHSKEFRRRGLAQCVVCHNNHDVAPATALLVGTTSEASCMKCHSTDEKPKKVADDIAALLRGARERAAGARAAVAKAHESGLHVTGAKYALDEVSTAEIKLRGVVHTLDPARVEGRVADIDRAVQKALGRVAEAERTRKLERRGYYVALSLAGLLFVTLALKALELDRRRRRQPPP